MKRRKQEKVTKGGGGGGRGKPGGRLLSMTMRAGLLHTRGVAYLVLCLGVLSLLPVWRGFCLCAHAHIETVVDDTREIPPLLNNAVRLAGYFSEVNEGSIQPGPRMDMEKAHMATLQAQQKGSSKERSKCKGCVFEDDFEGGARGFEWESILGGAVNTLCGSVSGRWSLCFGGDAFAADVRQEQQLAAFAFRQAVTSVMNTIAVSKARFSLAIAKEYKEEDNNNNSAEEKEKEEEGEEREREREMRAELGSSMGLGMGEEEGVFLQKMETNDVWNGTAGAQAKGVHEKSNSIVTFEFKPAGGAWTVLHSFTLSNYTKSTKVDSDTSSSGSPAHSDLPDQSRSIKGEKIFTFVQHEITLPEQSRSLATKFRWQQVKLDNSRSAGLVEDKSAFPSWAIDDVFIVEGGPPGVLLKMHGTDSFQEHLVSSKLLTVLVHVNTHVQGLDASKFVVEGDGRIVSLNKLSSTLGAQVGGGGDLYTLTFLKGRKEASVHLPENVCKDSQGVGNAASNVLAFPAGQ